MLRKRYDSADAKMAIIKRAKSGLLDAMAYRYRQNFINWEGADTVLPDVKSLDKSWERLAPTFWESSHAIDGLKSIDGFVWVQTESDWVEGTFRASQFEEEPVAGFEGLSPRIDRIAFDVYFELPALEAMSRSIGTTAPSQRITAGRPQKWDWEGALAHLAAIANTPDGLPSGHGAQSAIAKKMGEWFAAKDGDSPADSELRKRAAMIMASIDALPKTRN